MSAHKLSCLIALIFITGNAIHAQQARFGCQLTVSKPQGDLGNQDMLNGKLGFGCGIHTIIEKPNGFAFVPRIDFTRYSRNETKSNGYSSVDTEFSVNTLNVGMDINMHGDGQPSKGIYMLAGIGYSFAKFDESWTSHGTWSSGKVSESASKNALYAAFGVGGNINKSIAIELRYIALSDYDFEGKTISAPSINLSFVSHF